MDSRHESRGRRAVELAGKPPLCDLLIVLDEAVLDHQEDGLKLDFLNWLDLKRVL